MSMSDGVATLERNGTPSFDPDAEVCEIAGILNVANARLVATMETVLADEMWQGPGVHTPAQWLALKAGISPERANDIVRIARRRASFPTLIDVFGAGQLSVEQVAVAVKAPEWADADIVDFARLATVTQLRRKIRDEEFAGDPDEPATPLVEPKDRVSFGATGNGRWRLNANLDVATGSRIEAALIEAKDSLFEQHDEPVTWPKALVEVAEHFVVQAVKLAFDLLHSFPVGRCRLLHLLQSGNFLLEFIDLVTNQGASTSGLRCLPYIGCRSHQTQYDRRKPDCEKTAPRSKIDGHNAPGFG
mgnify:CR=1 FL=1